jgi:hypothetical protein
MPADKMAANSAQNDAEAARVFGTCTGPCFPVRSNATAGFSTASLDRRVEEHRELHVDRAAFHQETVKILDHLTKDNKCRKRKQEDAEQERDALKLQVEALQETNKRQELALEHVKKQLADREQVLACIAGAATAKSASTEIMFDNAGFEVTGTVFQY